MYLIMVLLMLSHPDSVYADVTFVTEKLELPYANVITQEVYEAFNF